MPWKTNSSQPLPQWSEDELEKIRQQQPAPGKTDLGAETPGTFDVFQQAAQRGFKEGLKTTEQGLTAPFANVAPEEKPQDYTAQLMGQSLRQGYSNPDWWVAQLTHGLTSSSPTLGAGVVGAGAGATVGGPPGALVGGATGLGAGAFVQTIAPAYQRARQSGLNHEDAVDAAIQQSQIAGLFSYASGLAPGASFFGREAGGSLKKPISEALAQIFGVQPSLIGAERVAANLAETGELPTTEDVETAMAVGTGTGAAIVGGHALGRAGARAAGDYAARGRTPEMIVEPPVARPEGPISFIDLVPDAEGTYGGSAPAQRALEPTRPLIEGPRGGLEGLPPQVTPGAEPPPPTPPRPGGGQETYASRAEFAERVRGASEPGPQYVTRSTPRTDFAAEPRAPLARNEYYHGGTYKSGPVEGALYLTKNYDDAVGFAELGHSWGKESEVSRLSMPLENPAPIDVVKRWADQAGIDTTHPTPESWFDASIHGDKEVKTLINFLKPKYDHVVFGDTVVAFPKGTAAQESKDYAIETAPLQGFYSPAQKAVQEAKHKKAPASQWVNQLTKGAAGREAKELGLDLWLQEKEKGAPVTAAEIQDWLKAHEVEVEETTQTGDDLGQPRGRVQPLAEGYREVLLRPKGLDYKSKHFDTNEAVAITLGDRVGPKGESYSALEHIQSDLHQGARKKGYADPIASRQQREDVAELSAIEKETSTVRNQVFDFIKATAPRNIPYADQEMIFSALFWDDPHDPIRYSGGLSYGEIIDDLRENQRFQSLLQQYRQLAKQHRGRAIELRERIQSRTGALSEKSPDAPFKDELWWQLGLKWAIGDAVRNGKEGLVLPTARQMAQAAATQEKTLAPFYDKKLPGWAGKYARSLGGEVTEEPIPDYASRHVPYDSRPKLRLAEGKSYQDVADFLRQYGELFKATAWDKKARVALNYGDYLSNMLSADPRDLNKYVETAIGNLFYEGHANERFNNELTEGFRDKQGNLHKGPLIKPSNLVIKFTPKMRENLSGGQPLYAQRPGKESAVAQLTGEQPKAGAKPGLFEEFKGRGKKRVQVSDKLSGVRLEQQVRQLLDSGRAVSVKPAVAERYFANHKLTGGLVPKDVSVNVLDRVEPVGPGRVRAVYKDEGGHEIPLYSPTEELFRARAFHYIDGFGNSGLFFSRLNPVGQSDQRVLGELWHESVHALRRNGYFPDDTWTRLLSHADSLSILDQDYKDFARQIKSPNWQQYASGVTLRDVYEEIYSNAYGDNNAEIEEALAQEAVAHMLERGQHGALTVEDLEPIQDIIAAMGAGQFNKKARAARPGKALAVEGPENPFSKNIDLEPVFVTEIEEFIDLDPVFETLDRREWENIDQVTQVLLDGNNAGYILHITNKPEVFLSNTGVQTPLLANSENPFVIALMDKMEEDPEEPIDIDSWDVETWESDPSEPVFHPQKNSEGQSVLIQKPTVPQPIENWADATKHASVVPGGEVPPVINKTAVFPINKMPNLLAATYEPVDENIPFKPIPGKKNGSGLIIIEPDGRVWVTSPTNQFGNYDQTFPKGTLERTEFSNLDLQMNAVKEAWEETGLYAEIVGFLGDYERSTSKARYYIARRVSGSPASMGWETQAMHLVPYDKAMELLNNKVDKQILSDAKTKEFFPGAEPTGQNYKELIAKVGDQMGLTKEQVAEAIDLLEADGSPEEIQRAPIGALAATFEQAFDLSDGEEPYLQDLADALFAMEKRQEINKQFETSDQKPLDENLAWDYKQPADAYNEEPKDDYNQDYLLGAMFGLIGMVSTTYGDLFEPIKATIKYTPQFIRPVFKSGTNSVDPVGFYIEADTGAKIVYDLNGVGALASHGTLLDLVGGTYKPRASQAQLGQKEPSSTYDKIKKSVKDALKKVTGDTGEPEPAPIKVGPDEVKPKFASIDKAVKAYSELLPSIGSTLEALAQPTFLDQISDHWKAGNEIAAYAEALYNYIDGQERDPSSPLTVEQWAVLNKLTWDLHKKSKPKYTGPAVASKEVLANPQTPFEHALKAVATQVTNNAFLQAHAPAELALFNKLQDFTAEDGQYLMSVGLDNWAKSYSGLTSADASVLLDFVKSFVPVVLDYDEPTLPEGAEENIPPSDYELNPEKYYPPHFKTVDEAIATLSLPSRELFKAINQPKWKKKLAQDIKNPTEALSASVLIYIEQNKNHLTPATYKELKRAAKGLLPRLKDAVNLSRQQRITQSLEAAEQAAGRVESTLELPQKVPAEKIKDYLPAHTKSVYDDIIKTKASHVYTEAQPKTTAEMNALFTGQAWDETAAKAIDEALIKDYSGELSPGDAKVKNELQQVAAALRGTVAGPLKTFKSFQDQLVKNYGARHYTFTGKAGGGTKPKEMWTDEEGNEYLFKPVPANKAYLAMAEVLGGQISQLISPDNPTIFPIQLEKRIGSMQRYVRTKGTLPEVGIKKPEDLNVDQLQAILREHVVDWLISNHDAHRNQFLVEGNGKIVSIDKGQAFKYFGKDKLDIDYHPNAVYGEREPIYNEIWRAYKEGRLDDQVNEMFPEIEEQKGRAEERIAELNTRIEELEQIIAKTENKYEELRQSTNKFMDNAIAEAIEDRDTGIADTQISMHSLLESFHSQLEAGVEDQSFNGNMTNLIDELINNYHAALTDSLSLDSAQSEELLTTLRHKRSALQGIAVGIKNSMQSAATNKLLVNFEDHLKSMMPSWNALASDELEYAARYLLREKMINKELSKLGLSYEKMPDIKQDLSTMRSERTGLDYTLRGISQNRLHAIFEPIREAIETINERLPDNEFIEALRPMAEERFKGQPTKIEAFLDYALIRKRNLANKFYKFLMALTDPRKQALGKGYVPDSYIQEAIIKDPLNKSNKLTDAEIKAIRKYSMDGSTTINNTLKKIEPLAKGSINLDWAKYAANAELLASGLRKLPPHEGTVFRGQADSNTPEAFKTGAIFYSKGFLSTSAEKSAAFGGKFQFVIQSKTGRYIKEYSGHKSEEEVLFMPDTVFYITKVLIDHDSNGRPKKYTVHMTELPEIDFKELN